MNGVSWLNTSAALWCGNLWHACVQGTFVILCVYVICQVGRRRIPAATRQGLWWLACAKLLIGLTWIVPVALPVLPAPSQAPRQISVATDPVLPIVPISHSPMPALTAPATVQLQAIGAASTPIIPDGLPSVRHSEIALGPAAYIGIVWLLSVLGFLIYCARHWAVSRRWLRSSRAVEAESPVFAELRELAEALGVRPLPRLMECPSIGTPLVIGFVRPVVVIPENFDRILSSQERRMALAHELAHIRRADLWLGLIPAAARMLFAGNPFVWLAAREYADTREAACDAIALRVTGAAPAQYGGLLLKMVSQPSLATAGHAALGFGPGYFTVRRRLLAIRDIALGPISRGMAALATVLLAIVALLLVPWQLTVHARSQRALKVSDRPAPAPAYTIIDLGALDGRGSYAAAINNQGQVVGGVIPNPRGRAGRAFLWEVGKLHGLGTLPAYRHSLANGINNHGQVIASSYNYEDYHHAFLWQDGKQALGTLPGYRFSKGMGINDGGEVAGWAQTGVRHTDGMLVAKAFLWHPKGRAENLGTLGGDYSYAYGINNRDQVVGKADLDSELLGRVETHAFVWTDGTMTDLGTLGGRDSLAYRINDSGLVVGAADTAYGGRHAFLWSDGRMRDLGSLAENGDSEARAVNGAGDVVGTSNLADSASQTHAVLWRGASAVDLNTTLPANSGWTLTSARDINDRGQIVGQGHLHGSEHAFLLTPVHIGTKSL